MKNKPNQIISPTIVDGTVTLPVKTATALLSLADKGGTRIHLADVRVIKGDGESVWLATTNGCAALYVRCEGAIALDKYTVLKVDAVKTAIAVAKAIKSATASVAITQGETVAPSLWQVYPSTRGASAASCGFDMKLLSSVADAVELASPGNGGRVQFGASVTDAVTVECPSGNVKALIMPMRLKGDEPRR